MSIGLDLAERHGAAVSAVGTRSPHAPQRRRDLEPELDPLAGEDELWAEEDLLWTPDEENYIRLVRRLWIAVVCCLLFWLAVAAAGLGVFELLPA